MLVNSQNLQLFLRRRPDGLQRSLPLPPGALAQVRHVGAVEQRKPRCTPGSASSRSSRNGSAPAPTSACCCTATPSRQQGLRKHHYAAAQPGGGRQDGPVHDPGPKALGRAVADHPDRLIADLILKGNRQTCYDGQFFFDSDHPVDGVGTVSNLDGNNTDNIKWMLVADSMGVMPFVYQVPGSRTTSTPWKTCGTSACCAPSRNSTSAPTAVQQRRLRPVAARLRLDQQHHHGPASKPPTPPCRRSRARAAPRWA